MNGRTSAALALVVAMSASACGVSRFEVSAVGGPVTPAPPVTLTLRPAPGASPTIQDRDRAVDVIGLRVSAMGIRAVTDATVEMIQVTVADGNDAPRLRPAMETAGVIDLVTWPGGNGPPEIGIFVVGSQPLWPEAAIHVAGGGSSSDGPSAINLIVMDASAAALASWSTDHVGDFLLLLLDGRVFATTAITAPIIDGRFTVSIPNGKELLPSFLIDAILESGPLPESWRQP